MRKQFTIGLLLAASVSVFSMTSFAEGIDDSKEYSFVFSEHVAEGEEVGTVHG